MYFTCCAARMRARALWRVCNYDWLNKPKKNSKCVRSSPTCNRVQNACDERKQRHERCDGARNVSNVQGTVLRHLCDHALGVVSSLLILSRLWLVNISQSHLVDFSERRLENEKEHTETQDT
eukprot:c12413_g1_i4.p1 GENE.c12413_g1_i4~~c12413_g1_i4.p1  ORF type:complete len:122 (-),score=23.38 c12413_g1_i4:104-469(-)